MGYSFKVLAFLLLSNILFISTATRTIEPECGSCSKPSPVLPIPPVTIPELPLPPVTGIIPPVTVPTLPVPPVTGIVPPVTEPNLPLPPVTGGIVPILPVPPVTVVVPPVTGVIVPPVIGVIPKIPVIGIVPLPPVILPPVGIPKLPVVTTTPNQGKPCAPSAHKKASCPINTLKLGACASVLGGTAPISIGAPVSNKCCPVISGLLDAEAAACLCTTLKIKALNLKIYVPIAFQLLITCGKTPPAGYTCPV